MSYDVMLNELKHVRYELWLGIVLLMIMNVSVSYGMDCLCIS